MAFAIPASAQPATTGSACVAATESAASPLALEDDAASGSVIADPVCDDVRAMSPNTMSDVEKALCLMLLGCIGVIGSQAARRKATKAFTA